MRIYAIWERKRFILILLASTLTIGVTGAIYVDVLFVGPVFDTTTIKLTPLGCLLSFPNRLEWIAFTILICVETLALVLLLFRSFIYFRTHSGVSRSSLMETLIKDGIFYYVCVLAASVTIVSIILSASPNLRNFLLVTVGALHSILSNRLLLRLRGAYDSISAPSSGGTIATSIVFNRTKRPVEFPMDALGNKEHQPPADNAKPRDVVLSTSIDETESSMSV